MIMPQWQKSS